MKKQKANIFFEKFSLLNSQEHTEDIKWSSSSSSDYENTSCYVARNKNDTRKRKRKKPAYKNTSNLDITIVDASKDAAKSLHREKSPILTTKCGDVPLSPILLTSRFPPNTSTSPILKQKSLRVRSPILKLKSVSPRNSVKVKKNLCFHQENKEFNFRTVECNLNPAKKNKAEYFHEDNSSNMKAGISSANNSTTSTDSMTDSKTMIEKNNLILKVKNYFNSHFSSENSSQNISDTQSPEDCKNEDVDILTCKTQSLTNIQPLGHNSTNSDCSTYLESNSKKVKYKKGGLAHRLNALLKKQQAKVSLWHHERFLAVNSNFVIPKGEVILFCAEKIDFKYGCYVVNVLDAKNERYKIIINSFYVNNDIFPNSILRLYEPYKIITTSCLKIIVNVCKFEFIEFNNN
ncbi:uncharacterized protein LOC113492297 [Trichoplusia ni]|uniref:Uncharacterized protein LOC113492297 n=1 Tax=Trichoplusia ni TaxID=7111 RepID=A0A7E5VB88_TRINI|nr:uncharacterized protein LOC113492297 [Trichoplusia ni]